MQWLSRLVPAPMVHIPSIQELQERENQIVKGIVQQHASGNVFLAAGRFEMPPDLFAEELDV